MALLLALRVPMAPHSMSVTAVRSNAPNMSYHMAPYEQCVLDARSEDDVAACMVLFDNDRYAPGRAEPLDELEACILGAENEDEVQACMQAADDGALLVDYKVDVTAAASSLGECLSLANGDIEHCILEADEKSDVHSYG